MIKQKYSIVVPVFNRERIIADVIQSILDQNYSDWELILIDDGSTDATKQVCKNFAENDARIHYIYKSNGGVSSARNCGIHTATGDYIIFVDSDNTIASNMLSVLNEELLGGDNPDVVVFGFNSSPTTRWLPTVNCESTIINRESILSLYLPTHLNLYKQDENFLLNYVWNKAFKRRFLMENDLAFDENRKTWEDGIFVINCLRYASILLLIPKVIYNAYSIYQVDHLSNSIFLNQLLQYICDETQFKIAFEKYYSFDGMYYCNSNIRVIEQLLAKTINAYGKDANETIKQALAMPIVKHWATNAVAEGKKEKKLLSMLINGNSDAVIKMYRQTQIKKILKKVKRTVKKGCTN